MRNNMKKFWKKIKWIFLIFILVLVVLIGLKLFQDYRAKKQAEEAVIKVACVGDSLTFGRSYTEEVYTYPTFLAEMLGEGYKVTNYGMGGTCVQTDLAYPYTTTRAYKASVEAECDVLILMLGSNDIWEPGWRDEQTFYQNYVTLIDSYLQAEKKPEIYLCTIPYMYMEENPMCTTYNEIGEKISNIVRGFANERGYHIIDMRQASIEHPEWYGDDGLHFNKEGAEGAAEVIYEILMEDRWLIIY